ncbi:MAG: tryptophan 7-halogenase [Flavobacteriales bacterium]|nr:tryptophan 7-halogenase [Flavobacteriales bacterium]
MNRPKEFFDAIIIGGGPAGAFAGAKLAMAGHKVLILEKEIFPRPHVGESLVPFCYDLFEEIGVLDKLKSNFVRKPGVRFVNKTGEFDTIYCFKNILPGPNQLSFHVLRSEFDKILLDNARDKGATVMEDVLVKDVDLSVEDAVTVYATNEDKELSFNARFLFDATGQDTFLGQKQRVKVKHKELDRIAFLTHWKGADFVPSIREGLLNIIYLAGNKKGWIGIQAVGEDRLSVGLVVDNIFTREMKEELSAKGTKDWKMELYLQEIRSAAFTSDILKNAEIIQKLMVVGNYSYSMTKKHGSNYAMIGDAASFLDPIFATGIYLAMNSAKVYSEALSVLLNDGIEEGKKALNTATENFEGAVQLVDRFIRMFYDQERFNFAELGQKLKERYGTNDDENFIQHQLAFGALHFMMGGDFFNENKRYHQTLDFLENPGQFERYYYLVMNRDAYKEQGCPMPYEAIFPMSVR